MKLLYTVLLYSLLGLVASRRLTDDLFFPKTKECLAELGMDVKIVYDNFNDNFISEEGNADVIKLAECVAKEIDAIDENNLIKADTLKPIMPRYVTLLNSSIGDPQQTANDAIDACKDVKYNSPGDGLLKISNCVVNYVLNN